MPLIKSASKKAFQKNVEAEMQAHPGKEHRAQNLAIAYSIKRKNKRKMAQGGAVKPHAEEGEVHSHPQMEIEGPIKCAHGGKAHCNMGCYAAGGEVELSAKSEKRPMPDEEFADHKEISENDHQKHLEKAGWTDDTWSEQASQSFSDEPSENEISFHDEKRANAYARGGAINPKLQQSHMEPDADEHYESIADAILAKKRKHKMMADGGEVDLEANSEESPNEEDQMSYRANGKEQYDLRQLGRQPMDSNEHGHELPDEDEHDMVDAIRRKMRARRGL